MSTPQYDSHKFHAKCHALSAGTLRLPLQHSIEEQGTHLLTEKGGYEHKTWNGHKIEGVLRYESAYTQVSGNDGVKPGQGWSTLATTVVEGFNVLEVLTCDRIVSQVITDHPKNNRVPMVTFLGSRFENLRIAGCPVNVELDIEPFGSWPSDESPYANKPENVHRARAQYENVLAYPGLPDVMRGKYNQLVGQLGSAEVLECSLVRQVTGSFPGTIAGHLLHIPHFGSVSLGMLKLEHSDFKQPGYAPRQSLFTLTMIELNLGCVTDGEGGAGSSQGGGTTHP